MLCVFFGRSFLWPGDMEMLWEVQRHQSWRTMASHGQGLKEPQALTTCSMLLSHAVHLGVPQHCPFPPSAKQGHQQAARVGVFHQSSDFEAPSPRKDKEEEEDS